MSREHKKNPPKWALRFFRWFCHPDYVEDIEGDLLERFEKRTNEKRAAGWLFTLDVFRLFRPGIIRNFEESQKVNYYGMFKNNIKMALRSASRQKQFSFLNLLGLTLGIATSIAIALYIHDELTYDTFHTKGDRIYRVNQPNIWGDWDEWASNTGPNVAVALRTEAPEFEEVTRILSQGAQTVYPGKDEKRNNPFKEERFYAAEDNFFRVFSFDFLAGDRTTALQEPRSMVLTLETAQRYFEKSQTPDQLIGQTVDVKSWNGSWEAFVIRGIIEDVPDKSHLQFDMLVSLNSYQELMEIHGWKWIWTAFSTYGLVHENTDVAILERKIQAIPPRYAAPTTERIFNQTFEEFTKGHPWTLDLQPLNEVYIAGAPDSQSFGPTGNPLFVKIFGAIGMLVLVLSIINFMNLSTARASNRAKEVGVRKVLGSERITLMGQFITESTLFVTVGTFLAIGIIQLIMPWFNELTGKQMDLGLLLSSGDVLAILVGFIVLISLLSGAYPAIYLSSVGPIKALKGNLRQGFKGKKLRNVLVVFQFTISIGLIICASFVQKQLTYASSLDLGFEKDNVLQVHNIEQYGFETENIKDNLEAISAVTAVGKSFGVPPNVWTGDRYKTTAPDAEVVQFNNVRTEGDYLELLGLEFLAGNNFDPSKPTDKYKIIINESATKALGWGDATAYDQDSPIGKKIALASGDEDEFEVIGVVKDFNFNSIRREIAPIIILHHLNDKVWDYGAGRSFYSLKLNPEAIQHSSDLLDVIEQVETQLSKVDPTVPFEFSFMDQDFEDTFRFEQKMGSVLNLFTLMALIIGCLGLFGLAAFSAEQRIKELSIRKVLGASITSLVYSFTTEFTRLILISIVIASPLAWYFIDQWLSEFAYRTPITLWVFIAAATGAILIACLTIGYQSMRVANKNPAETLKDE